MTQRLLNTQKIVNLSADPATGSAGEIYYNTAISALKYHDGTTWVEFGGGSPSSAPISTDIALSNSWWLGV
jgi:hypothetical protein